MPLALHGTAPPCLQDTEDSVTSTSQGPKPPADAISRDALRTFQEQLLGSLREELQAGATKLRSDLAEAMGSMRADIEAHTSSLHRELEDDFAKLRSDICRMKADLTLSGVVEELRSMREKGDSQTSTVLGEIHKVRAELEHAESMKAKSAVDFGPLMDALSRSSLELPRMTDEIGKLRAELMPKLMDEIRKVKGEVDFSTVNSSIAELKTHLQTHLQSLQEEKHGVDEVDFLQVAQKLREQRADVDFSSLLQGLCQLQTLVLLAMQACQRPEDATLRPANLNAAALPPAAAAPATPPSPPLAPCEAPE